MHGFESRVTTDIYPSDFAWTPNWQQADERIDKWYHNMQTVKESGQAMASFQIDYDDEVEFAARRKLFDYARDGAKPWCMVASFIHPHDPYVARPEWWDLYDDEEIDLPCHPEYATDAFGQRVLEGIEAYSKPLTQEEVRRARRAYYANVSYFDSKIGTLVQTVEEMGQLDNTIIIVTADHGDMLGEKGLWYKMNFFEHSARVPLIMAGPWRRTGADPKCLFSGGSVADNGRNRRRKRGYVWHACGWAFVDAFGAGRGRWSLRGHWRVLCRDDRTSRVYDPPWRYEIYSLRQ